MIDTLIFDFAGVVTKENFTPYFIRGCETKFGLDGAFVKSTFTEMIHPLMAGTKSAHDLWVAVCENTNISYTDFIEVFGQAYDVNEETVELIRKLRPKYRVSMLSDNFDVLSDNVKNDPKLSGLFEKIFLSNEIGMFKTMPGCFEYAIRELGVEPTTCVFIDDKEENLIPARKLGITGIQFKNPTQCEKDLIAVGVEV